MDDAEVEHRVVAGIAGLDGGVTHPQPDALAVARETVSGSGHHVGIDVEAVDGGRPEARQDDVGADAPTAADLEHPSSGDAPAEKLEEDSLVAALQRSAHRVVHQRLLDQVELHDMVPGSGSTQPSGRSGGAARSGGTVKDPEALDGAALALRAKRSTNAIMHSAPAIIEVDRLICQP